MAWLSVITVVKDDPEGFARTCASLREQDATGIEWVVVDGSADADEVPELMGYASDDLTTVYEHREPAGIYPAMNHALSLASGEYAYFLNSGDRLQDASVLRRVGEVLAASPEWAFGPVAIEEVGGGTVITPPWDYERERAVSFSRGLFAPHQGTFARTEVLRAFGGFDTSYRVAADYAVFLRLSLVADPVHLPFVIATFSEGGTSTLKWQESFREFHRARVAILGPTGVAALRERWETLAHYALVYTHREVRPRLSWPKRRTT